MLKTNTQNHFGVMLTTYANGSSTSVAAYSNIRALNVSPSPCANNGDRKLPNAYSFTVTDRWEPNGFHMQGKEQTGYTSYTGYLGGMYNAQPKETLQDQSASVRNRALSKLYDEIRNSEISVNTTIGEGRETLDMVMAVAHSAQNFIDNFRRAKKKLKRDVVSALRNPLQTVGGFELLWSVGLSPLINDVENLRNHVANKQELHTDIEVSSRASQKLEKTFKRVAFGVTETEERELSQRIEFSLVYRIDDLHAFENWRLGLTVRPTLLWELTTLSFVVDYFITIGDYLSNLEASLANNGITFVSGYETTGSRDSWWLSSEKPLVRLYSTITAGHSWAASGSVSKKQRKVLTSFPSPVRPTVKVPKAASQLLNCAALLSQLIKKR